MNVSGRISPKSIVRAPDNYINTGDLMKKVAPKEYAIYSSMMDEAIQKNDDHLMNNAMKYMIDWELQAYRTNLGLIEEERQKQVLDYDFLFRNLQEFADLLAGSSMDKFSPV